MKKQIEVAAAIIQKDHKILATQRGYGEFKGYWEFPGGKLEPGETAREALIREIKEELKTEISIHTPIPAYSYDYPEFHITLHCFLCSLTSDQMTLVEHSAAAWLTLDELDSVTWLPADVELIKELKPYLF